MTAATSSAAPPESPPPWTAYGSVPLRPAEPMPAPPYGEPPFYGDPSWPSADPAPLRYGGPPATTADPASAPLYGEPPRSGRLPLPLLVAAAVVLLVGATAAVFIYLRGGTSGDPGDASGAGDRQPVVSQATTAPGPAFDSTTDPTSQPIEPGASAQDQAAAIDTLLSQSVASRGKLNNAIDRVNRCTDLTGALSDMRDVGAERQTQLDAVRRADLSALPNGEQLRNTLSDALRHAYDADQAFVAWASPTISGGCGNTNGRQTSYERAQAASTKAQASKREFLALWNPIAGQWGLAHRTTKEI
jgi:hypothetical protein